MNILREAEVAKLPRWVSVSSEVFVDDSKLRTEMAATTEGDVVEMNLEGLLAACDNHGVSGLHLRVVSDHANEMAEQSFAAFCKNYRGDGGKLVAGVLKELPNDPKSINSYDQLKKLIEQKE